VYISRALNDRRSDRLRRWFAFGRFSFNGRFGGCSHTAALSGVLASIWRNCVKCNNVRKLEATLAVQLLSAPSNMPVLREFCPLTSCWELRFSTLVAGSEIPTTLPFQNPLSATVHRRCKPRWRGQKSIRPTAYSSSKSGRSWYQRVHESISTLTRCDEPLRFALQRHHRPSSTPSFACFRRLRLRFCSSNKCCTTSRDGKDYWKYDALAWSKGVAISGAWVDKIGWLQFSCLAGSINSFVHYQT